MPPHRRLVRRQPLSERLKSYLNPYDFLLWLSEELETSDWEQWQREWGTFIGIGTNFVMLVARANCGGRSRSYDDVFGDEPSGTSLLSWLVSRYCCRYKAIPANTLNRLPSWCTFSPSSPSPMLSTPSRESVIIGCSRRRSMRRRVHRQLIG